MNNNAKSRTAGNASIATLVAIFTITAASACGDEGGAQPDGGGSQGTGEGVADPSEPDGGGPGESQTGAEGAEGVAPEDEEEPGGEVVSPGTYQFPSKFGDGDSVATSGQILRHVLITDLVNRVGGMTERLDSGAFIPAPGDVMNDLRFYYEFDSEIGGELSHTVPTALPALQTVYDDIATAKNLKEKVAGNDAKGQHKDWMTGFRGWNQAEAQSPEGLILHWFEALDDLAVRRASGDIPTEPSGAPIAAVHVTENGQDIKELLQKFLLGAVAFSQGADDYLDDDIEGHGILSSNDPPSEGLSTELAHGWDEAFGYFGAARDYASYTDDEIAGAGGRDDYAKGQHDTNGDGKIDLTQEFNWGASTNAAKRDRGSNPAAPTDFTGEAFGAFLAGRALIHNTDGPLTESQLAELRGYRDTAVLAWEKAISSTIVHYINEVLMDMNKFNTPGYKFADHAKHWSELKGFALSLQFNPRSPLSDEAFERVHDLLGDAPVLPGAADVDAYRGGLLEARAIIGQAYGFAPENLGGDNGEGGW